MLNIPFGFDQRNEYSHKIPQSKNNRLTIQSLCWLSILEHKKQTMERWKDTDRHNYLKILPGLCLCSQKMVAQPYPVASLRLEAGLGRVARNSSSHLESCQVNKGLTSPMSRWSRLSGFLKTKFNNFSIELEPIKGPLLNDAIGPDVPFIKLEWYVCIIYCTGILNK